MQVQISDTILLKLRSLYKARDSAAELAASSPFDAMLVSYTSPLRHLCASINGLLQIVSHQRAC
jgi:hypothetical protein